MRLGSGLDSELGLGAAGVLGADQTAMTLSFANPHVAEKCRILASMEPGKWYRFGSLGLKSGSVTNYLVDNGLLTRNRPSRYRRNFEYILTPAGEQMAAMLKQMGATNGTH